MIFLAQLSAFLQLFIHVESFTGQITLLKVAGVGVVKVARKEYGGEGTINNVSFRPTTVGGNFQLPQLPKGRSPLCHPPLVP